jgi:hypothetical protein
MSKKYQKLKTVVWSMILWTSLHKTTFPKSRYMLSWTKSIGFWKR